MSYTYKCEVLRMVTGLNQARADEKTAGKLQQLLNQQAEDGWEFVSQNVHATLGTSATIIVTFRKEK